MKIHRIMLTMVFAVSALPAAAQEASGDGRVGVAVLTQATEGAINKGLLYLSKKQNADGSWPGMFGTSHRAGHTALMMLALLVADLPPTHRAIGRGLKYLAAQRPIATTYEASLTCMMLHALSEARREAKKARLDPKRRRSWLNASQRAWLRKLAARIAEGKLQAVIFFRDPNAAHPHEHDVQALLRLCDVYDVPLATNPASAQLLITGLQGDAAGARGADARALRAL